MTSEKVNPQDLCKCGHPYTRHIDQGGMCGGCGCPKFTPVVVKKKRFTGHD